MEYSQCWLNYKSIKNYQDAGLLEYIYGIKSSDSRDNRLVDNAVKELSSALRTMLGIDVKVEISDCPSGNKPDRGIILDIGGEAAEGLHEEGYRLRQEGELLYVNARSGKGILYSAFDIIRKVASKEPLRGTDRVEQPYNNLRMLNHWDNMNGDIERGYSGKSFFFRDEEVLVNSRTLDYARLLASVGINGAVINNVNVRGAASRLVTDRYLDKLREIADIFEGYGIKLYLSANFAAPIELGGLATADPLDREVADWWKACVKNIYNHIPDFGGFLIKADSEGRPGPFTYNRTHADGANLLARALKPYGGLLIWRCFVYNCQQDWRDYKTDRARAAYDNFIGLDGLFDDNVILQIKNGPVDFQVREPVSPLFGGLKNTNMILEVQAAQEYTGQQKDVCYLVPMWKEILDFETYACKEYGKVADIVSGRAYGQVNCGMAAVSNTGNDYNWTGHDLAAANFYGFGRLSWEPGLTSEQIAAEWIRQTFPESEQIFKVVKDILMGSLQTYEKYTVPLGIGWMVNPSHHYGPNVDGYEYDRWGTYHRADRNGLGVDRTRKGTGYTTQYNEPNASMYDNIETCPEELLLFFHYIRYDYMLKSGKTLMQHIYDTHFEGVEEVEGMLKAWEGLKDLLPEDVYDRVLKRFNMQLNNAVEWRDRINTYFYRKSGIDDEKHRRIYY